MEHLFNVLEFAGKGFIVLMVTVIILVLIAVLAAKSQRKKERLELENLNDKFTDYKHFLQSYLLDKKELKKIVKDEKKNEKKESKKKEEKNRLFVLDFNGDIKASQVEQLREEITAILSVAKPTDEVLVKVESPGGMVHGYGLAASQLLRVRKAGVSLTVSIDKVGASGGYLMACTANKIIAAPFAIVGSIGVVAQVPNLHRLLQKNSVDYEEFTAGEYKRTVSMLGPITPAGRQKFTEQLEDTHKLFKDFITQNRPKLDVVKVATGEHWLAAQALDLGLIDEILTSDEYILAKTQTMDTYLMTVNTPKRFKDWMSEAVSMIPWFKSPTNWTRDNLPMMKSSQSETDIEI